MTKSQTLPPSMDPAAEIFDIQSWPFYHLARATAIYTHRMDASLKPLGIDVARWRVLALLHRKGACTVTQLTVDAVSKLSTMAKIVQRMTAEGLVDVGPSPEDARSTIVTMTQAGKAMFDEVRAKVSRIGREALHDMSADEMQALNRLSAKLFDNLAP